MRSAGNGPHHYVRPRLAPVGRGEHRVVVFPMLACARPGCGKPQGHPIHRTAGHGDQHAAATAATG